MLSDNISIVIPNWDGQELLQKCIPSLIDAVNFYGKDCEIIVVDNASCDGSINYLQTTFPIIKILALEENLGFAKAINRGFKAARGNIVIGLNNDVLVEKDFIAPLISHFKGNGGIFSVAARMLLWDKKTLNFGRAIGKFRFGIFRRTFQEPPLFTNALYSCAGAFAVDKNKFLSLGGFDEEMIAFWEDLDLCYRAWKQGYKTIYEPKSIAYHKFHASFIKKCGMKGIQNISAESYFLFAIKNLHDRSLIFQQLISFPLLILAALFLGKTYFALGLVRSIKKWPLFLRKRRSEKIKSLFSDREVLFMASQ